MSATRNGTASRPGTAPPAVTAARQGAVLRSGAGARTWGGFNVVALRPGSLLWLLLGLLLTFASGCRSLGPGELIGTHALYNQAIATSRDHELLQNLVRLRYRESPYFLEVGSVTATMRVESSLSAGGSLIAGSGSNTVVPSAGVTYSSGPTIAYTPLQGEDFLRNVLTPISLESLFVLVQSGWSARRVFGIAVERINNLDNAPTASGPTPARAPRNQDRFLRLLELWETRRGAGQIESQINADTGELFVLLEAAGADDHDAELKRLLDLDPQQRVYKVDGEFFVPSADTISIRTRSIMSMLFYMSQHVDVPAQHVEAGLVTVTRTAGGGEYDWGQTAAGAQFHVRVADREPDSAFLAIPYRGQWFYLDDADLESKSSFLLLSQLFNLQAGNTQRAGPTLTIPVSQ